MRTPYKLLIVCVLFIIGFGSLIVFRQGPTEDVRGDRERRKNGRSGAMEALDFWTRSRAYPKNDLAEDSYYRAYQLLKTKTREVSKAMSAGSVWQPIGPVNLQGRALSVALNPKNPNAVYLGTASGGLWRSYTGGTGGDWQQIKL